MKTLSQLLEGKGRDVWSVDPGSAVYDAISMMAEKGIGAVLVVKDDTLVGILSERDYARKVILQGRASKETLVREIMTTRVVYARPEQSVEECLALMTDKRIRHLPVMDGATLLGVVSIGDLVKEIIAEQQFLIEQLENYIKG